MGRERERRMYSACICTCACNYVLFAMYHVQCVMEQYTVCVLKGFAYMYSTI